MEWWATCLAAWARSDSSTSILLVHLNTMHSMLYSLYLPFDDLALVSHQ